MEPSVSRFERPSSLLQMKALLRKTGKTLWWALALALGVHVSLSRIAGSQAEQKAAKPLTTQFVKRQPRLTKPLELKKRPQPKRRRVERAMVAVKARMQREQAGVGLQPRQLVRGLAKPSVEIGRISRLEGAGVEPQSIAQAIESAKEEKQRVDMSLELMDITALDTGKYHALVVQDPADRRHVRGFCHLAILYSERLHYPTSTKAEDTFEAYVLTGFLRLCRAMNQYTDIRTDVLGRFSLDDAEIFKAPWLLLSGGRNSTLTPVELENLGTYLISGGFVFADCANSFHFTSPSYASLRNTLLDGLGTQGIEAILEKLPKGHPVYHCYFDFDGPPAGGDLVYAARYPSLGRVVDYIEGLEIEGRLVALLSSKTYVYVWTFWGTALPSSENMDPRRQLQFGVNTIMFALTQEGSITHRLMDSIQY